MKLLAKIFLLFSICFFVYFFFLLATSSLPMNEFDGALRLLSQYYTSSGLIPYKDFGVVYPPGYFLLLGKIIPYVSIFQRNMIFTAIYGIIYFYFIRAFVETLGGQKDENYRNLKLSIFLISLTLVTNLFFYYDLLSILILPIFLYIIYLYDKNKIPLFIYIIFTIIPFIRWDFAVIVLAISIASFIFEHYITKKYNSSRKFLKIITCILLGFLLLILYLFKKKIAYPAFDFIVNIPAIVLKPYRYLPIPQFKIRPFENMMFYTTSILFLSYYYLIYRLIRNNLKIYPKYHLTKSVIISIILLISILPYTFSRISFSHIVPLWYLLIISYLLVPLKLNKLSYFAIIISFIPFITFYKNNYKSLIPKLNNTENIYNENSKECAIFKYTDAKSVFIGRTSYDLYDYSNAYLYYLYRNLKPATAYISDEPGLQDSCIYGSVIKNELLSSVKPMLSFLSTNPQIGFPNKKLSSCGKIEEFLKNNSFEILGNCSSYGFEYEVRLYK